MKRINQLGIATALALAALGVQAQTIETDYPVVGATAIAAAPASVSGSIAAQAGPLLVQSNSEGPRLADSRSAGAQTSDEVRANAKVRFLQAPDVDAS